MAYGHLGGALYNTTSMADIQETIRSKREKKNYNTTNHADLDSSNKTEMLALETHMRNDAMTFNTKVPTRLSKMSCAL